eukprot:TRINITY_DN4164_c0_g1_i1.p1 TRINITY_DN4164_c0_g1~~TRINITY_DN4164_c0_g1_i1.p1  ORF type:complete len:386 (+),score=44.30 TRINITY_DN4164_c0_g1_i1:1593-2750(+)
MFLSVLHAVLFIARWLSGPQAPIPPGFNGKFGVHVRKGIWADALPFRLWWQEAGGDYTIPLMTTVFWVALVCFGVLPWFRRRHYRWFWLAHSAYMVLIPTVLLHADGAYFFVAPGAVLWLVDIVARTARGGAEQVETVSAAVVGGTVCQLRFRWPGGRVREHSPAMFCRVNLPQVSSVEWHPFSLSSSPLDNECTLHVQRSELQGPGMPSWTRRLHALLGSGAPAHELVLQIDGPYGAPLSFECARVLLIAGGIGITPMHSTIRYLQQCPEAVQHARLVWSSRSLDMFEIFSPTVLIPDAILQPKLSLFCTGPEPTSHGRECSLGDVTPSRPDLLAILSEELEQGPTVVYACGPASLMQAAKLAVSRLPRELQRRCEFYDWSFVL